MTNSDSGCTAIDRVEVTSDFVKPDISILSPDILTCDKTNVVLVASSSFTSNYSFEWVNSDGILIGTEPQINVSEPDKYTLTILDLSNGCTSSMPVFVDQDLSTPTNIYANDGVIDCYSGEVILQGFVDEDDSDVTYSWINSDNELLSNSSDVSVSDSGIYTLVVTLNRTGCSTSIDAKAVSNMDIPNGVIIPEGTVLNCNTKSLNLNSTSSSSNVNYQWIGPTLNESTKNIEVMEPGTYHLAITNLDNGCVKNLDIEITENITHPSAIIKPPDIINCINETITLYSTIDNIEDIFYSWRSNDGSFSSKILNPTIVKEGKYFLDLIDKINHCKATIEVDVFSNFEIPLVDAGLDKTLDCNHLDAVIGTSSNANYYFRWTNENQEIIGTSDQITIDDPGLYQLMTTHPISGCTETDDILIDQDIEKPRIDILAPFIVLDCNHPDLQLIGQTNITNPIFSWSNMQGFHSNFDEISVDSFGQYELTITNPDNGCFNIQPIDISENFIEPNIQIVNPDILSCKTDAVLLSTVSIAGINQYRFEWMNENGVTLNTSKNLLVSHPGQYQLITTDTINGCTTTDDIFVNQNVIVPDVDAGMDKIMDCSKESLMLKGEATSANITSELQFDWFFKGVNISSEQTIDASNVGIYTLEVTDIENGCNDFDNVEIIASQDIPNAIAEVSNPITCEQEIAILDASKSIISSKSMGQLSYEWYFKGMLMGSEISLEISEPGEYLLIIHDNSNNCDDFTELTAILDKDQPPIPVIHPDTLTCTKNSIQIDGSVSSNKILSYSWLDMNNNIITHSSDIEIVNSGTFKMIIIDENNGCENELTLQIVENRIYPTAVAEVNDELDCTTHQVLLSAEKSSDNTSLFWSGVGIINQNDSFHPIVNQPGNFQLIVVDQKNGCADTSVVNVIEIENDLEALFVIEPENCLAKNNGIIEILDIKGGTPPFQYSMNGSIFSDKILSEGLAPGAYLMTIQDARGCLFQQSLIVDPWIPPTLDLGPDITIDLGNSITLKPQYSGIDVDSFVWNLPILNGEYPTFSPIEDTEVMTTLVDELGCKISDQLNIFINLEYPIYIPTAFTPNNDGINDIFMIFSKNNAVKEISTMMIFDRWGELVFENHHFLPNKSNEGWNGIFRKNTMQSAVFAYYFEVEFINGVKQLFKGDVTLIL